MANHIPPADAEAKRMQQEVQEKTSDTIFASPKQYAK